MTHLVKDELEAVRLTTLQSKHCNEHPSQIQSRRPYHRQSSDQIMDYQHVVADTCDATDSEPDLDRNGSLKYGLGLRNIHSTLTHIKRVPVGSKTFTAPPISLPISPLSPKSSRRGDLSQASTFADSPWKSYEGHGGEWAHLTRDSFNPSQKTTSQYGSNVDLIDQSQKQDPACPTQGDVLTTPWNSMTVSILVLAIYSTVFSGIFLGIALARPRWGERIGVKGSMSFSTATLLNALFSKTVELSFVIVFVALLGQILSRRAFTKRSPRAGGISISEMTMRTWIMQPGSSITHWKTVKYAALTGLGVLVLLATLAATVYTTAAEALVALKLKFGSQEQRTLSGTVAMAFASSEYLSNNCDTPTRHLDLVTPGLTCLQTQYAGQSYRDFSTWLAEWEEVSKSGNATATSYLDGRPLPFAMLYDNTTISGQWISPSRENITADSALYGRLVQNVTFAMSHSDLFNAVREPANHIPQPQELQGQGQYEVVASIPAPMLNILCVSMTKEELKPFIYSSSEEGPRNNMPVTSVDQLFNFGVGSGQQPAPQFIKIPIPLNTVYNATEGFGTNAVYLLATPPDTISVDYHILCSLKASLYSNCSTRYNASEAGGSLSVHCDTDPLNPMPYIDSDPEAALGVVQENWKSIGSEWLRSTALSHGVNDANASIARLVTQMIPQYSPNTPVTLNAALPSIAEALGVLAGSTLIASSSRSPFVHFYNYSSTVLETPQTQYFKASVRFKGYQSGGNQEWQNIFYVVLFTVFAINIFALVYLIKRVFWDHGHVTDYTEPEKLFAIANLSPPSQSLRGACGGGPHGEMFSKKFRVGMKLGEDEAVEYSVDARSNARRHPHLYVKCVDDEFDAGQVEDSDVSGHVRERKRKTRNRPRSLATWYELDETESPAVEQYRRLVS